MTSRQFRKARIALGLRWFGSPLTLSEFGRLLRLSGDDVGASVRDYERGKTQVSGPLSLAVDLLLAHQHTAPDWMNDD